MVTFLKTEAFRVVVVSPVYDDAAAARQLLSHLEKTFAETDVELRILFVDDGSPVPLHEQLLFPPLTAGIEANVLRLRRNVGHQRAIALGVAYVHEHTECDAVLVMDADGEDRPEDARALVARCRSEGNSRILFAERTRRSESPMFQIFYRLYQVLHWVLTGIRVRVGNFSVVPSRLLPALVTLPALWNHFAAAIFQARLPRDMMPTVRGHRYSGISKMNLVALVVHGLQAISVFIEVVAVRVLIAICLFAVGCAGLLAATIAIKWQSGVSLTGWAPLASAGLLILVMAVALGCFCLTLGFLNQRNSLDFIPIRDYSFFVEGLHPVTISHERTELCGRRA